MCELTSPGTKSVEKKYIETDLTSLSSNCQTENQLLKKFRDMHSS